MKLILRAEDRVDRQDWPEERSIEMRAKVEGGGVHAGRLTSGPTPTPTPALALAFGRETGLSGAWRVPGFTRPARLSRADWLIRGFTLLSERGAQALTLAALCDCPGGSRQGFIGYFQDLAGFRDEMIALWESVGLKAIVMSGPGEGEAAGSGDASRQDVLSRLLDLADEAVEGDCDRAGRGAGRGAGQGDGQEGTGDSMVGAADAGQIERAMRDWAASDFAVAAALTRVDRHRLEALRALLLAAGLSPRRAQERAAVFYAARLGFDMLRNSAGIAAAAPMRALALAILGAREAPSREPALKPDRPG